MIKPPSASETSLLYFAVDNISPPNRNSFMSIIRSLEDNLKNAPHVKQEVPLAWIKCRDEFLRKAENDKIVSLALKDAKEVMKGYGVANGKAEEALEFFH